MTKKKKEKKKKKQIWVPLFLFYTISRSFDGMQSTHTDRPKLACHLNFFEVGDIKKHPVGVCTEEVTKSGSLLPFSI